ncbi:PD40 domain-containing protein [Dyella sp. C11]|uniref:TolB family protein n=1 Tax=Dyella sp. C11 TaxID=2126991 RepID=UPI0018E58DB5|nr:PD40 domain-containing protein [Dyella sp. C11]
MSKTPKGLRRAMLPLAMMFGCVHAQSPGTAAIRFVAVDPEGVDYGPQFSPDSQRLIFDRRGLFGGRWETYVVGIDGGTPQPFAKDEIPVAQTRTRWSHAHAIAFTGMHLDGTGHTWVMNDDGTHAHLAIPTSDAMNSFYPSWYPDGKALLEMSGDDQSLRKLDLASGTATPLSIRPALFTGMASASPDGRWIVVAAQANAGQKYDQTKNQIWLISASGDAHPLESKAGEGRAPTWSPDGRRVLFESNRASAKPEMYAVFVADVDGKNVRRLTPYALNAQHPTWSPDGKWIAFSARQSKKAGLFAPGIAVMPAPGSGDGMPPDAPDVPEQVHSAGQPSQ